MHRLQDLAREEMGRAKLHLATGADMGLEEDESATAAQSRSSRN
ncbi:hypothetical protein OG879_30510 [Streptomyces caniferus]|nr:hypothetical protein [Streptomyces caniferus]